jgi:hypothetical protein
MKFVPRAEFETRRRSIGANFCLAGCSTTDFVTSMGRARFSGTHKKVEKIAKK